METIPHPPGQYGIMAAMNQSRAGKVTIRKACAQDQKPILNLIGKHRAADARQARQTYREYFQAGARPRDLVFVAEKESQIVGVSGFWYDEYSDYGVYWLNWTYVHPQHRSQGIGDLLLRHVLSALRKKRARKLFVDTSANPSYQRGLRFYLAHGFKLEGILRDYYGPGEDQIILGKELSS